MEITEKYTKRKFVTQRELDIFRATPEYRAIREEWLNKWSKEYECVLCDAIFSTYEELRNHYYAIHEDKITEAASQAAQMIITSKR